MYNPNFKKETLRKNLAELKLLPSEIDRFVSRIGLLIASETQNFPEKFYDVKKAAKKLQTSRPSLSDEAAIQAILDEPKLLYTLNDIEPLEEKPEAPKASTYSVSPFLRLQAHRQRRELGGVISKATIEMLAIPAIDKIPPGVKRVREFGDIEQDPQDLPVKIKSSAQSHATARRPVYEMGKKDGRSKYHPTDREIADAGRAYSAAHDGRGPQGQAKGNEYLPEGSKAWATLFLQYLKGDNTLGKIMRRNPPLQPDGSVAEIQTSEPAAQFQQATGNNAPASEENSQSVTAGRGNVIPPHAVIAAAGWAYKAKHGTKPHGVGGSEFLPANSMSWSTLTIHHLKGDDSLAKIMKRYPPGANAAQIDTQAQAPTITPAPAPVKAPEPVVQKIAAPAAKPDELKSAPRPQVSSVAKIAAAPQKQILRSSFNPMANEKIKPYEIETNHLNPRQLAVLAAIKEDCKKSDLLQRSNEIFQEAGKTVLTRMFHGAELSREEFETRSPEFFLKLREELLEIVVADKDDLEIAVPPGPVLVRT